MPFRELGFKYSSHNRPKYRAGEFVYHESHDAFYVATANSPYQEPSGSSQVWKRLGIIAWTNVQSYPAHSIVTYDGNSYISTAQINAYSSNPNSNANWHQLVVVGDYNPATTYSRYQMVNYNDQQYFWNGTNSTTLGTNPETDAGWWLYGEAWHFKNTYAVHSLVLYNGTYWTLRTGTSTNQVPGEDGAWQELTDRWTPTNIYLNNQYTRSMVIHNDLLFMWTGDDGVTTDEPGTGFNGWQELTQIWRPYNTYEEGDKVIYDGSFWEALQSPYTLDEFDNPIPIVPGTDFLVWKEYDIIWNPNRG